MGRWWRYKWITFHPSLTGSEENALAMLAMTAFTLMTRRGICEMQNVAPDGKGIRLELIGFRGNETIPDTLH
ncbi:hypothetical protein F1A48_004420 [Escherichia coli]|nr:hypothetical protein [Escherichia coli]EIG3313973.1 hypothetical protein [Escherichia coli]